MTQATMQIPAKPTGLDMRVQINAILIALLTQNSGPDAPTSTWPGMWWGDTTAGRFKRRKNDDTGWIDIGPLDDFLGDLRTTIANNATTAAAASAANASAISTNASAIAANASAISALDAAKAPKNDAALTGTPTAPTPATTDNSTKIATTAFTQAGKYGGAGQVCQNFTAYRAFGTTYYNDTGRVLHVEVTASVASGQSLTLIKAGLARQKISNNTNFTTDLFVSSDVMPGDSYAVTVGGSPVFTWSEDR